MSDLIIRGGKVLADGVWTATDVGLRDGRIEPVAAVDPDADVLDATGLLVAPGYIDLQCNGGPGIDLAREPERLWDLAALLPASGVTAWLPTIVSTPPGVVDRALAVLAAGPPEGWRGAAALGLHLEGPFLSVKGRGAHPPELLRDPVVDAIEGWSRAGGVALVTLAPELPGALDVVRTLVAREVVVSIGHTHATTDEVLAAVDAGATWVTHLFNGMVPLHHREPGPVGVALTDPRVRVGLIPDGVHVHPRAVALAQRALGDRLTIVTDAVAGTTRLPDGTLAGSDLRMDDGVRNLAAFSGCAPEAALHAASSAPAALLGDAERGSLRGGARADIVLLDAQLRLVATVAGGEVLHDARQ